jgi:hypothetical protein
MEKSIVLIFNCPPSSGKDTLFKYLYEEFYTKHGITINHREFKSKLIDIALTCSSIDKPTWDEYYQSNKDTPWSRLNGLSPRQLLMRISEEWIKPTFGLDYFGRVLSNEVKERGIYIVTDGGFTEEIQPILNLPNIDLFICQWKRINTNTNEPYNFNSDSRNYIYNYPTINLPTNTNLDNWLSDCYNQLEPIILRYK